MSLEFNDLTRAALPLPDNMNLGSLSCHQHRSSGELTYRTMAYAPGIAGNYFSSIFRVNGQVDLKALYGVFTVCGNVANGPSNCYFTFDDGAAAVNLTDGTPGVGGVNCTGALVNTMICKVAPAANVATYFVGTQCRYQEQVTGGTARTFFGGILQSKPTVATNYIRWMYTTAGAGAWSIWWAVIWSCWYPGSYIDTVTP